MRMPFPTIFPTIYEPLKIKLYVRNISLQNKTNNNVALQGSVVTLVHKKGHHKLMEQNMLQYIWSN